MHPTKALSLASFKKMDELAVREYELPISLMMENAGLILAKLIAKHRSAETKITIGVGNGNNGGGGLVAARRLAGWGYSVFLDIPVPITKELPKIQLRRAVLFGASREKIIEPGVWVDAYLGFSQRLPLSEAFIQAIKIANSSRALRISLDLPTGISASRKDPVFRADKVITLAAPKKILSTLHESTEILIADIGIPKSLYAKFNLRMPAFYDHTSL